jgi:hypothetical protein
VTMYDQLSARNTSSVAITSNVAIPFQYGETRPVFETLPLYDTTPLASEDYSVISQYDSFMMSPVAPLGQALYGEATRSNKISNAIAFNMKYDTS